MKQITLDNIETILSDWVIKTLQMTSSGGYSLPDFYVNNRLTGDLMLAIQTLTNIKIHRKNKTVTEHFRKQQNKILTTILQD